MRKRLSWPERLLRVVERRGRVKKEVMMEMKEEREVERVEVRSLAERFPLGTDAKESNVQFIQRSKAQKYDLLPVRLWKETH